MKRLLSLLLLAAPAALSAQAPGPKPQSPKVQGPKAQGPKAQGIVSAADPRAAAAGAEILRAGGSATDAAIATMLALNVVEPQSSGIGGGAFFVHQDARGARPWTVDGREAAPAAADGRWFFGPDGKALKAGTLVRNPEQAAQFAAIARLGPDSFYVGPAAQAIVSAVNGAARNPSRMTAGDLASYDAKTRPPVCGSYRSYRICGMGPPSAGATTVLAILKQLERFDLRAMGPRSATAWHLFAESSRLAYADRDLYLGDPDHVRVPIAGLTDARYLATRSALIAPDRTMASVSAGTPPGAPPRVRATVRAEAGTTSLSASDAAGNVAQVTATIESPFGSGLTANGSFLNNELTDFDLAPETDGYLAANRVEGGKRPRSSMSPTIVYDASGRVRLAVGAAGGSTIIAQVTKAIIGVIDWDMTAQAAIGHGLLYAPGPVATAEAGTELEAMAPALRALGERIEVAPLGLKANAVEWRDGRWQGGADPRSEGATVAEDGTVTEPPRAVALERPPE